MCTTTTPNPVDDSNHSKNAPSDEGSLGEVQEPVVAVELAVEEGGAGDGSIMNSVSIKDGTDDGDAAAKKPEEKPAATTAVDEEVAAAATTKDVSAAVTKDAEEEEADEEGATAKKVEEVKDEYFPWWKGGGKIPKNGHDLGVFEKSLEDRANIIDLLLLRFLNPLLSLGSRKVLDHNDIGIPSEQDLSSRAYANAQHEWEKQVKHCTEVNTKRQAEYDALVSKCTTEEEKEKIKKPTLLEPSISWALVSSFGATRIFISMICYFISALLTFVPVIILNDLVSYFEHVAVGKPKETYVGFEWATIPPWIEVVLLGVVPLLSSTLQTRYQSTMAHCGVFVRTAVSTLLYQKSLTVSAAGRAKTSTGQVVNMMSNDTMQLQRFLQFGGMTLVAPIQIIVALYLIFREVSKNEKNSRD